MIQNGGNNVISPKPLYGHRKNKVKLGEDRYGGHTDFGMPTTEFNQNNSSSVHSISSLDESNSTTDSGFNSVVVPRPLLPSPNSAFSPKYPSQIYQNILNCDLQVSPLNNPVSDSNQNFASSEATGGDMTDDVKLPNKHFVEIDRASIYSEPLLQSNHNNSDNDWETSSYVYTRGRQRYRRDPNHSTLIIAADVGNDNRSQSRDRYTTRIERKREEDRKNMFNQFIAQAEERDQQARREQQAMKNFTHSRSHSASRTGDRPTWNGNNLKRSSSTSSCAKPTTTYGIRRSGSVDIQDMIKKAEKRDSLARVEQARLEGLVPPRRYLGQKSIVRTGSDKSTSSIIKQLENKTEASCLTSTAGHEEKKNVSNQTLPGRKHRKFKSFLTNSRLARSDASQVSYRHQHTATTDNFDRESLTSTSSRIEANLRDLRSSVNFGTSAKTEINRSKNHPKSDEESFSQRIQPISKDISGFATTMDGLEQFKESNQQGGFDEIQTMKEEKESKLNAIWKNQEAEAREDAEREFLELKLSIGKPKNFFSSHKKYTPTSSVDSCSAVDSKSNKQVQVPPFKHAASPTSSFSNINHGCYRSRPVMRTHARPASARPASDGLALEKSTWQRSPPSSETCSNSSRGYDERSRVSFISSTTTPKVIGLQEVYNDPRTKREATIKRDQFKKRRGPDPSRLSFKDRQRLFQGGSSSPINKPKSSRKLLELEASLEGWV